MGLLSVLLVLVGLIYTAHCQFRGTIRLVRNGYSHSSYSSGIVQIYYFTSSSSSNRWGNICDDSSFTDTEANVICNQLGYDGASTHGSAGSTSSYGTDSSYIILDDVSCSSSNYLTLQQCTFSTNIASTCSYYYYYDYDVYVVCYSTRIWNNPYSGQIRLQGGTYSSYGRLEVYCNGQWGTVCDDTFDSSDARVVCRQLGYSDVYTYHSGSSYAGSSSQPIWLDRVSCSSSYNCLASCESCPSSQYHNCGHNEDVAVGCQFDTYRTASSNTLSTCQYASTEGTTSTSTTSTNTTTTYTSNEGGIIAGIVVAVLICFIVIFALPISISCCLGFAGATANDRRSGRATVVTTGATSTGATVTTTNTSNVTAPPPAYDQQPPPAAAYPAGGYEAKKTAYPPQQGYPAQVYV